MTKPRGRAKRVDYTDFLSPAAKAPASAAAKKPGKRKGHKDDDYEDNDDRVPVWPKETKPKPKKLKQEKAKITNTRSAPPRELADHESDDDSDAAKLRADSRVSQHDREVEDAVSDELEAPSRDLEALRKKYDDLREFRETETERLLQEARALAHEEKRTSEKLIAKLKDEVAALASRSQEAEIAHKKRVETLQTEFDLRLDVLRREREDAHISNQRLRKQIRALEGELIVASSKRSTRSSDGQSRQSTGVHMAARAADENVELAQAKTLLNVYREVTSTEIRLIETLDEDDEDEDGSTDVACAVIDSVTGKRFTFDLAIPPTDSEDIEYLPSEQPSSVFKVPSYLQEDLTFKRTELTKFMRTLLDVVVRKKRQTDEAKS